MSNHYHLLLETPWGNLPRIMRHINGAYTIYFNVKRKRSGHLFQGRYKAILMEADSYAAELSRYIHLNPIRVGLVEKPEDYPWSSYRSYIGQIPPAQWLKTEFILSYFGQPGTKTGLGYRHFVEELQGRDYVSPLRKAIGTAVLGTADFVERVTANHLDDREHEKDVPAHRQLLSKPSPQKILKAVEKSFWNKQETCPPDRHVSLPPIQRQGESRDRRIVRRRVIRHNGSQSSVAGTDRRGCKAGRGNSRGKERIGNLKFGELTPWWGFETCPFCGRLDRLNNRPRKCLNYRTPQEVFEEARSGVLTI